MGQEHKLQIVLSDEPSFQREVWLVDAVNLGDSWIEDSDSTGYDIRDAEIAGFSGGAGLLMETGDSSPLEDQYIEATKRCAMGRATSLMCRFVVSPHDVSTIGLMRWSIWHADAARLYKLGFEWTPNSGALKYLNSSGSYTTISGIGHTCPDRAWNDVEFRFDMAAHEYTDISFGGTLVSLEGIAYQNSAANTQKFTELILWHDNAGNAASVSYWDNFYIGVPKA